MRRAHDRSSENQVGQQGDPTSTGPGTATGAAATGPSTTGRETEGQYSTGTRTYEQGAPQQAAYGRTGRGRAGEFDSASMQSVESTTHGGLFLVLAGLLTFLVGLAFVVRHGFYHAHGLYAYNWGIVSWGWVLFGLGIATFAVGACHLLNLPFARYLGIALAVLTVVAGFMVIPFYPLWAIIIVALGIAAVWGLAHGAEIERDREYERQRVIDREQQMSRM